MAVFISVNRLVGNNSDATRANGGGDGEVCGREKKKLATAGSELGVITYRCGINQAVQRQLCKLQEGERRDKKKEKVLRWMLKAVWKRETRKRT